MAALTLVATPDPDEPTVDDCVDCNGAGEIPTGEREWETGQPVVRPCSSCEGGLVPAESTSTCSVCSVRFWTGDGCDHGPEPLCLDCRGRCDECLSIAREDAGLEALRYEVLKAGGWS